MFVFQKKRVRANLTLWGLACHLSTSWQSIIAERRAAITTESCDQLRTDSLFVSLVYCAESTVRWFVVREKHRWMAADSADKSKRTG
jgi:hypothetical protein